MALSRDGLIAGMSNLAPQQNQQAAQGVGDSAAFAQKQQAGQAYMGGQQLGKPQVAQMGAQLAGQKAQANLAAAQTTEQQQGQLAQQGLQAQAAANKQALGEKQLGLQKKQRDLTNQIAGMGEEVKNKILDSNLAFQKDELGRTQFNERQLMDWKITQAKSQEEYAAYEQQARQVAARKQQYLKMAQAKINAEIERISQDKMLAADHVTQEKLMRAKLSVDTQLAHEKNAAANRAGMWGAGGTIVGAAIGGQTGAQIGQGAGQMIGGALG